MFFQMLPTTRRSYELIFPTELEYSFWDVNDRIPFVDCTLTE